MPLLPASIAVPVLPELFSTEIHPFTLFSFPSSTVLPLCMFPFIVTPLLVFSSLCVPIDPDPTTALEEMVTPHPDDAVQELLPP
jgi:hypothetical protein